MDGYLAKPFRAHELFATVEGFGAPPAAALPEPARTSSTGAPDPPVELERFRRELGEAGVAGMLDQLISVFLTDAPGRMHDVEEAIAGTDPTRVQHAAHAFKSSAGTIRAVRLAEALDAMEAAGRDGNLESAVRLLEPVRREHAVAMRYLERAAGKGTVQVQD